MNNFEIKVEPNQINKFRYYIGPNFQKQNVNNIYIQQSQHSQSIPQLQQQFQQQIPTHQISPSLSSQQLPSHHQISTQQIPPPPPNRIQQQISQQQISQQQISQQQLQQHSISHISQQIPQLSQPLPTLTQQISQISQVQPSPPPYSNFFLFDNNNSSSSLTPNINYGQINKLNNEKLFQNNSYQLRKLKKARLKRQKKAEYIDFLKKRISQIERIIRQHNLHYEDPVNYDNNTTSNNNTPSSTTSTLTISSTSTTTTPSFIKTEFTTHFTGTDHQGSDSVKNFNIDPRDTNSQHQEFSSTLPLYNPYHPNKRACRIVNDHGFKQSESSLKSSYKKGNENRWSMKDYEEIVVDQTVLLKLDAMNTDIEIVVKKDMILLADEFFNIPDEIEPTFSKNEKEDEQWEVKNNCSNSFYYKTKKPIYNANSSIYNNQFDANSILNVSFCLDDFSYTKYSEANDLKEVVISIILDVFKNSSFFPPEDLINMPLLKKDLNSHNPFLIYSICAHGLISIVNDMPINIKNITNFHNEIINSTNIKEINEYFINCIKGKKITYKEIITFANIFYQQALKHVNEASDLQSVESFISLSIYTFFIGKYSLSWQYIGMAIRKATFMNLAGESPTMNRMENIIRKRIWWKCYIYDGYSMQLTNNNPYFEENHIGAIRVAKLDIYGTRSRNIIKRKELQLESETNNNKRKVASVQKETPVVISEILFKYTSIWKKTTYFKNRLKQKLTNSNYFNSLHKNKCNLFTMDNCSPDDKINKAFKENHGLFSSSDCLLDPKLEQLKIDIRDWWRSIPSIFKTISIIKNTIEPKTLKFIATLSFFYYGNTLLLHRPMKKLKDFCWTEHGKPTLHSKARAMCLQACQGTARVLYRYQKLGIIDLIANANIFAIFESAITIICDFYAELNMKKINPSEINKEDQEKRVLLLNIFIVYFYHKSKHIIIANSMLTFIYKFCQKYGIQTIMVEKKTKC